MKKLLSIFAASILLASCSSRADIEEAVVVEQINIKNDGNYKYEVKLKTRPMEGGEGGEAYYHTNFRFQVGDTLVSYYQNFDMKSKELIAAKNEIQDLKAKNDSLDKELKSCKYYLQILQEKLIINGSK